MARQLTTIQAGSLTTAIVNYESFIVPPTPYTRVVFFKTPIRTIKSLVGLGYASYCTSKSTGRTCDCVIVTPAGRDALANYYNQAGSPESAKELTESYINQAELIAQEPNTFTYSIRYDAVIFDSIIATYPQFLRMKGIDLKVEDRDQDYVWLTAICYGTYAATHLRSVCNHAGANYDMI